MGFVELGSVEAACEVDGQSKRVHTPMSHRVLSCLRRSSVVM